MTQIEKICAEIERLKEQSVKSLTDGEEHAQFEYDVACGYENALIELKTFIESLEEEEQEDTDFVKQELKRIREAQKKVKLPELIDFWWMQEDMEGNQMIAKDKEHFAQAMRKAYNVGLSQSESLEKEQDGTLTEQRRIDTLKQVQKECERELQEQYDNGYDDGWKAHEKVIAEYQKKEQPQGLDEAAEEFARTTFTQPYSETPEKEITIIEPDKLVGFKAGAKWMAEQKSLK